MRFASAEEALVFYREHINAHDFDRLIPVIADDAVFWFGDASHVGIDAVRGAFEDTWARLVDETYWLDELNWLGLGDEVSACHYRFHWRARVSGQEREGGGRGTTVLARRPAGWQIVHEHLSAEPQLAEKLCPVVLRTTPTGREILVLRHPQAGIQLAKGTREDREPIESGALRELAEESGIVSARGVKALGSSDTIVDGQIWHFLEVECQGLADEWVHEAADDGGHRFEFFWWPLSRVPDSDWHVSFRRALQYLITQMA